MWIIFALLSAVFAAAVSILAKIGIEGVDSNLAVAVRTSVAFLLAWGIVFLSGAAKGAAGLSRRSLAFLVLSGAATGLSWLFYYKALQIGQASKVAPVDKLSVVLTVALSFIILKEPVSAKTAAGCLLIAAGALIIAKGG
ncbi:MAG: EamA family transporter [Clostridiales bacterium]|jgi:transporter family protein|nr:EamA family transporter [Clostridiales bacterium]